MSESPDDRYEMVRLAEWERLHDALDRFCNGRVQADAQRIACRMGSATFAVTRDGTVEAGMPLHQFDGEHVDALGFDPDGRSILVTGPDVRYVFRHP
jgi:hypothetical protein